MKTNPLTRLFLWLTIAALACNAPFLKQQGGGGGMTTVAQPQALLSPAQYADTARSLATAIAELNRVQEQTLEHLRSSPAPETVDGDLTQTAAAAMTVAQLAEQLAASTASQAGGSQEATAAAQPYVAAAQMGYLVVIETQNAREDYKAGRASSDDVSHMIGDTGGMMWSGDHFDVGNTPAPFDNVRTNPGTAPPTTALTPEAADTVRDQFNQSSGKSNELASWSSSTSQTMVIRVVVPAPRGLLSGSQDPARLAQMRTPEGQSDADVVRVAAVSKLVSLGGTTSATTSSALAAMWPGAWAGGDLVIEITVPAVLVFQSQFGRALPYFVDGTSGATAKADSGGPFVSKVDVSSGQPQIEPPIEVNTDQPPVTLQITNAVPTGAETADTRDLNLTVQWSTTLANPTFVLACYTATGHSATAPASGASGEATLLLTFSQLADTAVCQAKTVDQATTLGESQVIGLEATASAAATQAALEASQPSTYDGSYTLNQSDEGCNFSAAPVTSGTIQIVADYDGGTASGSFSGSGGGLRTGLDCSGNFADLTWSQLYTGTFSGTVDAAGNLNMTGTISGSGTGEWSNCHDANNQPFTCPTYTSGPYSYPVSVTGALNKDAATGNGQIIVTNINLATLGTWTVP